VLASSFAPARSRLIASTFGVDRAKSRIAQDRPGADTAGRSTELRARTRLRTPRMYHRRGEGPRFGRPRPGARIMRTRARPVRAGVRAGRSGRCAWSWASVLRRARNRHRGSGRPQGIWDAPPPRIAGQSRAARKRGRTRDPFVARRCGACRRVSGPSPTAGMLRRRTAGTNSLGEGDLLHLVRRLPV
jgi:hypothetical protein